MPTRLTIPAREFGPAPWWAWLGDPTPASIDRDLRRFLAMEIFEVIIIPLYGLQPAYLGRRYLDLFRHVCRRCRQWGMALWLYDEFNWPSGTCAGRVLLQHPQFRQRVIRLARPAAAGRRGGRLSWRVADPDRFQLAAYGAAWANHATGYLDTLNPEAVRAFLEMTHEVYRRELGEYFGTVIRGFFTDEPVTGGGLDFPYTPGLFARFRQAYGYDLRPRLAALVADAPDAARVRRDYWSLVRDLFRDAFFRPYAAWCAAHGLRLTGHLLHEESLGIHVSLHGDLSEMLAEMQTPGIDLLGGLTSYDAGPHAARDLTGKLLDSVACFAGRDRTLCEAFGCMPHSSTAQAYKRAADFLFHHGLSMINDNLFPDSLAAFRKFCGCHAFRTPWTRHYRLLSRHVRTLSWLNAGAPLETGVGVYWPGADARARYAPPRSVERGPFYFDPAWQRTQQAVVEVVHGLSRRHWNHYLVFDAALRAARPAPGGLRLRKFVCQALVLPEIRFLSEPIAAALRRFVQAGGFLLCLGQAPEVLDAAGRARPAHWPAGGRVRVLRAGLDEAAATVADALRERGLRPPVPLAGPGASDVMVTRRRTRAGDLVLMSNFGPRAANLRAGLAGAWRRLDTLSGALGDPAPTALRLLPNETAAFLRSGRRARPAPAPRPGPTVRLRDTWSLDLPGGNTISLPLSLYLGPATRRPPTAGRARDWAPPRAEFPPRPLTPGRAYWLRRELIVTHRPARLDLIVDGEDACDIYLNRRRLPTAPGGALWDDANRRCDLRPALRRGRNELLVRYTPAPVRRFVSRMVPLDDLALFVLRGDVLAASRLDLPELAPTFSALPGTVDTGPLQERGYPHLTGAADYRQTVTLPRPGPRVTLDMGRQNDAFDVTVNGRAAGVLLWPPYRLEVGALLKPGANRFRFRLVTALGGIISRYYKSVEKDKPPVGMLETPVLRAWTPGGQ